MRRDLHLEGHLALSGPGARATLHGEDASVVLAVPTWRDAWTVWRHLLRPIRRAVGRGGLPVHAALRVGTTDAARPAPDATRSRLLLAGLVRAILVRLTGTARARIGPVVGRFG